MELGDRCTTLLFGGFREWNSENNFERGDGFEMGVEGFKRKIKGKRDEMAIFLFDEWFAHRNFLAEPPRFNFFFFCLCCPTTCFIPLPLRGSFLRSQNNPERRRNSRELSAKLSERQHTPFIFFHRLWWRGGFSNIPPKKVKGKGKPIMGCVANSVGRV